MGPTPGALAEIGFPASRSTFLIQEFKLTMVGGETAIMAG